MRSQLLVISLFCCSLLIAQEEEPLQQSYSPLFLGGYFQTFLPQGDFKDKMGRPGYGGHLHFMVKVRDSPAYLGISTGIYNFGREVLEFVDNEGYELEWKTNSSLWNTHLTTRFEPPMDFYIQPYMEVKAGFDHFFTTTRLVDPEAEDETLERYVDNKDWNFSYGGSAGILIPLDKEWHFMLDISASYLRGTNARFFAKKDNFTIDEDTIDAFELRQSAINMIGLQIGVLAFIN